MRIAQTVNWPLFHPDTTLPITESQGSEPMTNTKSILQKHGFNQTSSYKACYITPPEPPGPRFAVILHTELESAFLNDLTQALQGGKYIAQVLPPTDLSEFNYRPIAMGERLQPARLLVLDDRIGGRSAFEYLLNLKSYDEIKDIPLCLLTSDDCDTFARNAYLAAGVDLLVDKTNQKQISRFANPLRTLRKNSWRLFTESGSQVVDLAHQEAIRWHENQVSTEHLLLALVHDDLALEQPAAVQILEEKFGLKPERIRAETERRLQPGPGREDESKLTPSGTRITEMAFDEAWMLGDDAIGTEHWLLGMVRDGTGLAGRVLSSLGVDLESVRSAVLAYRTP
jgi:hypothetical protein